MASTKNVQLKPVDVAKLVDVQNQLSSALIKTAVAGGLIQAKDWVQGGWSRGSAQFTDKLDFGLRKDTSKA